MYLADESKGFDIPTGDCANVMNIMYRITLFMESKKEYYQQTVLDRPEELQILVLDFLQSLPKKV